MEGVRKNWSRRSVQATARGIYLGMHGVFVLFCFVKFCHPIFSMCKKSYKSVSWEVMYFFFLACETPWRKDDLQYPMCLCITPIFHNITFINEKGMLFLGSVPWDILGNITLDGKTAFQSSGAKFAKVYNPLCRFHCEHRIRDRLWGPKSCLPSATTWSTVIWCTNYIGCSRL